MTIVRDISSNQNLARPLTSTPKVIARKHSSRLLSNSQFSEAGCGRGGGGGNSPNKRCLCRACVNKSPPENLQCLSLIFGRHAQKISKFTKIELITSCLLEISEISRLRQNLQILPKQRLVELRSPVDVTMTLVPPTWNATKIVDVDSEWRRICVNRKFNFTNISYQPVIGARGISHPTEERGQHAGQNTHQPRDLELETNSTSWSPSKLVELTAQPGSPTQVRYCPCQQPDLCNSQATRGELAEPVPFR